MSQKERFGSRDLTYSAWHRLPSLQRYVGIECAQTCAMIDMDARCWVECDHRTYRPLALIEEARDVGQNDKNSTLIKNEARRGAACGEDIPAYTLLYTPANHPNPADPNWPDIAAFRVRRIWPESEAGWQRLTPAEWAARLISIRKWSAAKLDRILNREREAAA